MLAPSFDYCSINPASKPRLLVVVDTEEEFDWSRGFSRRSTSVRAMRSIHKAQALFDAYGITPVYVIDYPVAFQAGGYRPLQEIHQAGRCVIGAHLHPWVNPPLEEEVTAENSFPGNLPSPLEAAKLRILGDTIGERFGSSPVVYKAGRYGVGPRTAAILEEQGYEVDLSVCPHMDYSAEGGPDFRAHSVLPYWFGAGRRLLEVPLTVDFTGLLRRWGKQLEPLFCRPWLRHLHAPGVLAQLNLLNRAWLSPEGNRPRETIGLVRTLHRDGVRVFSFAFHSPSLEVGNTSYVTSHGELDSFLSHCKSFFDYFFGTLGGEAVTPLQIKAELASSSGNAMVRNRES